MTLEIGKKSEFFNVFCQLQVVLRWWKISLRNDVRIKPGEVKESYADFLYDYKGQSMWFCY